MLKRHLNTADGLFFVGIMTVLGVLAGTCAHSALALSPDDFDPRNPDHALALAVAKVAMNEAPGSPADAALIWQVVEGRAQTSEDRLAWLRRHSPCVTGQLSPETASRRRGNCRWTSELEWSGAQPSSWPEAWNWERHRVTWRRTRALVWALVTGRERRRPCEERPVSWGGPMDHAQATRRGLRVVVCRGTANAGYRRR